MDIYSFWIGVGSTIFIEIILLIAIIQIDKKVREKIK